jgi:hypothetical protein
MLIVNSLGELLVNVLVVERHGPAQRSAQVRVQIVSTPKRPLSTLEVDVVDTTAISIDAGLSMDTKGQD